MKRSRLKSLSTVKTLQRVSVLQGKLQFVPDLQGFPSNLREPGSGLSWNDAHLRLIVRDSSAEGFGKRNMVLA